MQVQMFLVLISQTVWIHAQHLCRSNLKTVANMSARHSPKPENLRLPPSHRHRHDETSGLGGEGGPRGLSRRLVQGDGAARED